MLDIITDLKCSLEHFTKINAALVAEKEKLTLVIKQKGAAEKMRN